MRSASGTSYYDGLTPAQIGSVAIMAIDTGVALAIRRAVPRRATVA